MAQIQRDARGRFVARVDTLQLPQETADLAVIDGILTGYQGSFDARWRMLNHMCVKHLGRSWLLARPKSDFSE